MQIRKLWKWSPQTPSRLLWSAAITGYVLSTWRTYGAFHHREARYRCFTTYIVTCLNGVQRLLEQEVDSTPHSWVIQVRDTRRISPAQPPRKAKSNLPDIADLHNEDKGGSLTRS